MKRILLIGLAAAALAACETTPNPYPNGPGFYETQVESNRMRISYLVPKNVSRNQAEDSLLMRAADDTLEKGFTWFRVIERGRDVDTSQPRTSLSIGTGSTNFSRRSSFGVGVGTTIDLSGGPRTVLVMEIVMGSGQRPNDPAAYDAQDVAQSLRERS
jgi:hypothetical protein